ncbi:hypothetical protein AAG570_000734 [Ranatra chinensis]|uniref:FAM194 C-terminal domain-containing protein n=1 Tax=Ranatra chinensis TaxID=642074 RepID=A0ABD0YXX2_9HEMI
MTRKSKRRVRTAPGKKVDPLKKIQSLNESSTDGVLIEHLIKATDLAGNTYDSKIDGGQILISAKKSSGHTQEAGMKGRRTFRTGTSVSHARRSGVETIRNGDSAPQAASRLEILARDQRPPLYLQFNQALIKLFEKYKELSSTSISSQMTSPEFSQLAVRSEVPEKPGWVEEDRGYPGIGASFKFGVKGFEFFMKDLTDCGDIEAEETVASEHTPSAKTATAITGSRLGKTARLATAKNKSKVNIPVIRYKLSSLENIMNGLTAPPESLEMTRLYTFEAESSEKKFSCFRTREREETRYYREGSLALRFEIDGTGMIFYPNGQPAIIISDSRIGRRLLILSQSGKDSTGAFKKAVPIGLFDSKGNGVIYDICGKIRMNYDQAEGVLYDSACGLPVRWKWEDGQYVMQRRQELAALVEDPPDWEPEPWQTAEDKQSPLGKKKKYTRGGTAKQSRQTRHSRPARPTSVVVCCNPPTNRTVTAKSLTGTPFRESRRAAELKSGTKNARQIPAPSKRPKKCVISTPNLFVLGLNKNIALRLMNQGHIHIDFQCQQIHTSLNIGMKVKPENLERIDKGVKEVGAALPCYFESAFMRTRSLRVLSQAINTIRKHTVKENNNRIIQKARLWGYPNQERKAKLKRPMLIYQLLKKQGGKLSQ